LTAWIMAGLVIVGWLRMYFWPHHASLTHPHPHLRAFNAVFLTALDVIAFVCIFYYARGRNWARMTVLLVSILSILYLLRLHREGTAAQIIGVVWGLLGFFFLYWLNTRPVREFFKRGSAAFEPPANLTPGS